MWITEDNFVIKRPTAITIDGVNHPSDIFTEWSKEELASVGIKPFTETTVDLQYYDVTSVVDIETDGVVTRNYGTKHKYTIEQLRIIKMNSVNEAAYSLLQPTDWYIVRNTETGDTIPTAVTDRRAEIRQISNTAESYINSETDYQTLINYQVDWNESP
jgi:hypothetical protein